MNGASLQAERFATSLVRQAFGISALACAVMVASPLAAGGSEWTGALLLCAAVLFGLLALGLSGLLAFDAFLFRLLAAQPDEARGGQVVDQFLATARLKPMPAGTRGLDARIAGTRRFMVAQRVSIVVSALSFGAALLVMRGAA